ncbi:MAG: zinc-ribbon domain-containing protein [Candidatus Baldrarchaeia archaeon]
MSTKYCPYCGAQLPPGASFCPKCGASVQVAPATPTTQQPATPVTTTPVSPPPTRPPTTVVVGAKSPGVAAILSLLIPGLGQIYVGRVGRGLLILFIVMPLTFVIASLTLIFVFLPLIIWIWQIFDAYNLAKKYNDYLLSIGQPPW